MHRHHPCNQRDDVCNRTLIYLHAISLVALKTSWPAAGRPIGDDGLELGQELDGPAVPRRRAAEGQLRPGPRGAGPDLLPRRRRADYN